jgi:hypothetical protein
MVFHLLLRSPVYRLGIHQKIPGDDGAELKEDGQIRTCDVLTMEGRVKIRPMRLLDLPEDLLAHIFSYLDFGTVQNILPFVCAQFDRVARGAVFLDEFHIECGMVVGGLQDRELELVCRRKSHIRKMRINAEVVPDEWTNQNIPRVIFDLAAQNHWKNLTHLSIEGYFESNIEEMFMSVLRSGSLRNLQHLRAMVDRPLSCHSLTYWDTPNLKNVQYRTGLHYWEFFPQNNFDPLFRAPGNLTHFTLDWSPFVMFTGSGREALGDWPYAANHFLDRCQLHNSVKSLALLSSPNSVQFALGIPRWSMRLSTLINPWPKVTHLRVRSFVFEDDAYEWVLQKFPSLIELVVEFVRWTCDPYRGERLKDRLLEVLGGGWKGIKCTQGSGMSLVSVRLWKRS